MPVEHERDALDRLVAGGAGVELLDRDVAGDAQTRAQVGRVGERLALFGRDAQRIALDQSVGHRRLFKFRERVYASAC